MLTERVVGDVDHRLPLDVSADRLLGL